MGRSKGSKNSKNKLSKLQEKIVKQTKVIEQNISLSMGPKLEKEVDKEMIKKGKDIVKDFNDKEEIKVNPKLAKIKELMKETNKILGTNTLKFASEEQTVDRVSFGNVELDHLTGGGIAHKRFNILWGPKSAGKTTLCYKLIAEAQKQDKVCAFIDLERTFDPVWAVKMGINIEQLVLGSSFNTAEEALDFFIQLVRNNAVDLIILDSIQALSPKGEQTTKKGVEKSLEDDTMALLARKLSQFFRIASGAVYSSNTAILLVGQSRVNLGGFIAFDTLSGGNALAHWASMILHVTRGAKADAPVRKFKDEEGKQQTEVIGFDVAIKLEKRKITSEVEGSTIHIPFYFDRGITT